MPEQTPSDLPATPSVSVIIAAWNAAAFLERAVLSAVSQEGVGVVEVILVDDCSTDGTAEVITRLVQAHPGVRHTKTPRNGGPAVARNLAISMCRGNWIAVLDADDAFAPGRLVRLIEAATTANVDVIADLPLFYDLAAGEMDKAQLPASASISLLDLEALLQIDPETGLDLGLLKPMFKASLRDRGLLHYPEKIRHGEDHSLYIALVRVGVRFGFLREPFYVFSTRIGGSSGLYSPGSVTRVNYRKMARQNLDLYADLQQAGELSPEIGRALLKKINHAYRNNRIYGWTALRKKNWGRFWPWLMQHPANGPIILGTLLRKLAGHRGLPD